MENVLEALKQTFKPKNNQNKAVLNLCGVLTYNIVDGLSKQFCDLLPYLKTKKNDLITTHAKRGTTTVHCLKLICDRRCTSMSFVYFFNVWVIILDSKGYWITKSEWKIVHCPTHHFRWGQDSRPFVLQFAKKFLSNYYSLSFKERNVLALILCCYFNYYLP